MKIGCIVQARTTSSRLPEKVLLPLPQNSDITVLSQVIRRLNHSKKIDNIIIATTVNSTDDKIQEIAEKENVQFFRGSEDDVLSRYYYAAKQNNIDLIIRVTSDCPCIDSKLIDELIELHFKDNNDYTTIGLVRSYPHGLDTEIFSFDILEEMFLNSTEKFEREHVTPYIYKTHADKFKIANYSYKKDCSNIRITLDTLQDYILLSAVYDFLYKQNNNFTTDEIVNLFEKKKWLYDINSSVEQKLVCNNLEEEIKEAIRILKKQDLNKAVKFIEEKYYNS